MKRTLKLKLIALGFGLLYAWAFFSSPWLIAGTIAMVALALVGGSLAYMHINVFEYARNGLIWAGSWNLIVFLLTLRELVHHKPAYGIVWLTPLIPVIITVIVSYTIGEDAWYNPPRDAHMPAE